MNTTPRPIRNPHSAIRNQKSGFTLIEILLVIAIIAMVAVVALRQLDIIGTTEDAKRDTTTIQIQQLATTVQRFYLDTGRLPSSLNDLVTNPGVDNWRGPYERRLPTDQWGDPFVYTVSGRQFEIRSNAGGSERGPISSNDL